jgi:catalase
MNDGEPNQISRQPPLSTKNLVLRLIAIATLIVAIIALFAYAGGWLTPYALTPARMVDRFEMVDGVHPGFRLNHAKGVCVSGWFDSNGRGGTLSKASVFRAGRVPVIGRFSLAGGNPHVADNASMVRGFAILFKLQDGEEWRTAMINLPVFPFATVKAFYDQLLALHPDPATGKPDPTRMKAFLAKYPETAKALQIIQGHSMSSGFDNSTFNSLNSFRFINDTGEVAWIRWSMVPVQPFRPIDTAHPEQADKNYLFDALIASIHRQPLQWRLILTVAQPGDPVDDATLPWPLERQQIDVGTLTLNNVESEDTSPTRNIVFDPLVLPNGIVASDDSLLSARSVVYMESFTLREGQHKTPSAVSTAETEK